MKIGVIRYPGTNCFNDIMNNNILQSMGDCIELWYKDYVPPNFELLILPGGFAFGDRYYEEATGSYTYSPGKMTKDAPITKTIIEAHEKNVPIIGICNGFQILTILGLLPGNFIENKCGKFNSKCVDLEYDLDGKKKDTKMYIANYHGNYNVQSEDINEKNIFLRYKGFDNGSTLSIAGIMNEKQNVFGMMPHPERPVDGSYSSFFPLLKYILKLEGDIFYKVNTLLKSEHISYCSTKKYLRDLYYDDLLEKNGGHVIQGPGENAGIVDIGGGYCISLRIESHNHPTYKDAYEGAATGVGGIIRDIICMGSKPIALLDFLRFGIDKNSDKLLTEAIKGIGYYGNTIGIPNVGGSLYRGDIYNKNPLVNVACIGIMKRENIIYGNALNEGSLLVLCGAKTGNEGVDSAIMASKQSNNNEEENMQKSDAYLENLLMDAFYEISETKLAEGCQDLGAGGILCATTEVIKRGREKTKADLGCNLFLDRVSLKCELDDYSILASESQERMLLVIKPENIETISNILKKWELEHNIIGEVTMTGLYNVYIDKNIVLSEQFINMEEKDNDLKLKSSIKEYEIKKIKNNKLWESYDSSIGRRTIKGPDKPEHYSILDIHEINKELIITWADNVEDCYGKAKELNSNPLGIVNCLNFGDPKTCIKDFKDSIEHMNKQCRVLKVPVLGGNVSMYNSTDNKDIPPSIVIVMISIR